MLLEDKGVITSYQMALSGKFAHSTRKQHSEGETDLIVFILCVCLRVHACHGVCGGQRINLRESVFSFLHVVPRIQTQVIGLGSKPL